MFECSAVPIHESEVLLPILLLAEEGEERVRIALLDPTYTTYAARVDGELIGAATVRWEQDDTSEIVYIAVKPEWAGKGYGKQIITYLQTELRVRGGSVLLVGTANSSLSNLIFYQKCGFRMFEIRRNYFDYIQPPIFENGVAIHDMVVLRYEVG